MLTDAQAFANVLALEKKEKKELVLIPCFTVYKKVHFLALFSIQISPVHGRF